MFQTRGKDSIILKDLFWRGVGSAGLRALPRRVGCFLATLFLFVALSALFARSSFAQDRATPSLCDSDAAYEDESLFENYLLNCAEPIDWTKILSGVRLAIVGDGIHSENMSKVHLGNMMGVFSRDAGVTDIGLEAISGSDVPLVNRYMATGEGKDEIEQMLDDGLLCPETSVAVAKIVADARKYGMRLTSLIPDAVKINGKMKSRPFNERNKYAAKNIVEALKIPNSKIVAVVGPAHVEPDGLPAMIIRLAKKRGVKPFQLVLVQIIGMESEPYLTMYDEKFKYERVARNVGLKKKSFMFHRKFKKSGMTIYYVHLPQEEAYSEYSERCYLPDNKSSDK